MTWKVTVKAYHTHTVSSWFKCTEKFTNESRNTRIKIKGCKINTLTNALTG